MLIHLPKDKCIHYWKIETPNGERSKGTCKSCGLVRYFYNHIQNIPSLYKPNPGFKRDGVNTLYKRMRRKTIIDRE